MQKRALAVLLFAFLAALGALPVVAHAAPRDTDDAVVVTGRVDVPRGERAGTVVVVHGDVDVQRGGVVEEDVVVVDGDVRVAGRIDGDLVTLAGRALILRGGEVGGTVRYGDKRPQVAPGATIGGDIEKLDPDLGGVAPFIGALAWWLAVTFSTLALGLLALWLSPRAAEAVATRMRRGGWGPASGIGFVVFLGLPVIAVIALATLVGIPFGVGLLLSLLPLAALGYVTSAWTLGRALVEPPGRRVMAFLAGWAILRGVALIPFFGVIVFFVAAIFGLGALAHTLWSARSGSGPSPGAEPAAAPAS